MNKLYFIGDLHGNFNYLKHMLKDIRNSYLIQVGDFGIGFTDYLNDKDILDLNSKTVTNLPLVQSKANDNKSKNKIALRENKPDGTEYANKLKRSAISAFNKEDFYGAVYYLNQRLEIFKDDLILLKKRGISYLKLKRYSRAKRDFSEIMKVNPTDSEIFLHMGILQMELMDFQGAIKFLKQENGVIFSKRSEKIIYDNVSFLSPVPLKLLF